MKKFQEKQEFLSKESITLKENYESEIKEKIQEITNLKYQLESSQSEHSNAKNVFENRIVSLENMNKELNSQLLESKQEFFQVNLTLKSELDSLSKELSFKNQEKCRLITKFKSIQDQIGILVSFMDSKNTCHSTLVKGLMIKMTNLESCVEKLKNQFNKIQKEYPKLLSIVNEQKENLKSECMSLKTEMKEKESELSFNHSKLQELKSL